MAGFQILDEPPGWLEVKGGPGYAYYSFATGKLVPMTVAGMGRKRAFPIQMDDPIPGGAGGPKPLGYLVGSGAAFIVKADANFTPDAPPVPDCTKEIAAAVALDRGKAKIVYS